MIFSEPKWMRGCPIPSGPRPEFFTHEQVCYIAEAHKILPYEVLNAESINKLVIIRSGDPCDREIFYGSQALLDFIKAYEERKREEEHKREERRIKARQRKPRKASIKGEQPAKLAKHNKGNAKQ